MDPEIAVQLLVEDEGLTSDLDEADALPFITALAGMVRRNVPATNAPAWLDDVRAKARHIVAIVVAVRAKRLSDAHALAKQHGFRWPTNMNELLPQLLAQLGKRGG